MSHQYPAPPPGQSGPQYGQQPGWDTGYDSGATRIAAPPTVPPYTPPTPGGGGGGGNGRRIGIIALISVMVAAVLGGGAFAAFKVFGGGPQPADALPASTLGVVSVDLDPSATQKISAIKTLRKFPGIKKQLGLQADDDLRRYFFDKAIKNTGCKDAISYDTDVKPWIGDRAALAGVKLGSGNPSPAAVLEVTDVSKARAAVKKIITCSKASNDFGYAFSSKFLILSDSTKHAQEIVDQGKKSPLSKDAAYKKWTGAAGDAGVINFYVAKAAAPYLSDSGSLAKLGLGEADEFGSSGVVGEASAYVAGSAAGSDSARTASTPSFLKDFQGLGGTIRFADGGFELETASGGADVAGSGDAGDQVASLPKDTALALGVSVPDGAVKSMLDSVSKSSGTSADQLIQEVQSELGITLPDDLETLLGKSLVLSVGGDVPDDLSQLKSPADLPIGLSVEGDPTKIKGVISKIEAHTGASLDELQLVQSTSGDHYTLATSQKYADKIGQKGSLGDDSTFKQVVPHAEKSSSVFYVNFDSQWPQAIDSAQNSDDEGSGGEDSFMKNVDPLKALGASTWRDGSTTHTLVKITTD